jgi:hypothetical protein
MALREVMFVLFHMGGGRGAYAQTTGVTVTCIWVARGGHD